MNILAIIIIAIILIIILCIISFHIEVKRLCHLSTEELNKYLSDKCGDPSVFHSHDVYKLYTDNLRKNWKTIKEEFLNYEKEYLIPNYADISPELSGNTIGWKPVFLRIFNSNTDIITHFPKTTYLINQVLCTTAYFSLLEPGTKIKPHKGVYKGVIRYHLGLIVPEDFENVFIVVDNQKLHWHEGEDLLFDDMFEHYVENNTSERRVVLFLDIKRDFKNMYMNLINSLLLKVVKSNDILTSVVKKANRYHKKRE